MQMFKFDKAKHAENIVLNWSKFQNGFANMTNQAWLFQGAENIKANGENNGLAFSPFQRNSVIDVSFPHLLFKTVL